MIRASADRDCDRAAGVANLARQPDKVAPVVDDISALPSGYRIDQMARAKADIIDGWAAAEGWNPGLHDIDIAWSYDPGAFIALRKDNAPAGGGAIIAYEGAAGFMGLFIMRADLRRQGLGRILWHERLKRLRARLRPSARSAWTACSTWRRSMRRAASNISIAT
jgi:hypothetical protein